MRKVMSLFICMSLFLLSSCDIHEWPETPEYVKCNLRLNYETVMTKWEYIYDGEKIIEQGLGESYENNLEDGMIRYVIRTYPVSEKQRSLQEYTQEFVFTKEIGNAYDHELTLDLLPGNYNLMVWSDFIQTSDMVHFYNVENFTGIALLSDYYGSTNYRDAFSGQVSVSLAPNNFNQMSYTVDICMKRPLAKFEIVTGDLLEFIDTNDRELDQYKAKIQYIGFLPDTYSLFADRPVASTTGVMFESALTPLTDLEASIGFDYVFASDNGTTVTTKIGIYDNKDRMVSMSDPITIPLKPGHHTLLRGKFMMYDTSNGVDIDTNWGGDYNIVLR